VISKHPLANSGGVQVGEQLRWHLFGLTINAATVISTAIVAAIVVGGGLYLAATATVKVPSGLQLIFETVIDLDELVRPVTLALRLFGNMLAGMVMVAVLALLPAAVYFGFAAGPDQDRLR
jgi:F0F1-type ATP synthase membrane subunit a